MPPKPKPNPANQKPTLSKAEQAALDQTKAVTDAESEQFKLALRKECRALKQ